MFKVYLEYFGLFDSKTWICDCPFLTDAILIVDALLKHLKGRPFRISIVNLDNTDIDSYAYDGKRDLQEYFDGIYCL